MTGVVVPAAHLPNCDALLMFSWLNSRFLPYLAASVRNKVSVVVQAPHAGGFQQRTLADIILQKIQDKERAQGQASTSGYATWHAVSAHLLQYWRRLLSCFSCFWHLLLWHVLLLSLLPPSPFSCSTIIFFCLLFFSCCTCFLFLCFLCTIIFFLLLSCCCLFSILTISSCHPHWNVLRGNINKLPKQL